MWCFNYRSIIWRISFFNGGDISVLTEKELKEISGMTSSTIDKMKKDCNRPKVIRLIDRNKALGELK